MVILKVDWNSYFKIPEEMLPFVAKMRSVKEQGDAWITDSRKLEVLFVDGDIATGDNALIARIKQLESAIKSEEDTSANLRARIKELTKPA
jgi:hypothetical protein